MSSNIRSVHAYVFSVHGYAQIECRNIIKWLFRNDF